MTALIEALELAAHGLRVFPCRDNKAPCTPRGFHDAVFDPGAVRELWRQYPGELIGVPTGQENGFDAPDIDPDKGGDAWLSWHRHRLPVTRAHQTRRGGLHFLFEHLPGIRNSESKLAPGVDVRGEGGYVIWWPGFGGDIVHSGVPAPWPDWLPPLLIPQPRASGAVTPARPRRIGKMGTHAESIIARTLYRLETARPGERHAHLRAAACTLGGLLDAAAISESQATLVLFDAVKRAGGDAVSETNAMGTIAWGLAKGRQSPLAIGDSDA